MSDNEEENEQFDDDDKQDDNDHPNDNLKRKRDDEVDKTTNEEEHEEITNNSEPPAKKQKKDKEKFSFPSSTAPPEIPVARVKRLVKSDPEVNQVTQEAVCVIAKATELFLEVIAKECFGFTQLDKRKTVQYKDVVQAVHGNDVLDFLNVVVPLKERPAYLASKPVTETKEKKTEEETTTGENKENKENKQKEKKKRGPKAKVSTNADENTNNNDVTPKVPKPRKKKEQVVDTKQRTMKNFFVQ